MNNVKFYAQSATKNNVNVADVTTIHIPHVKNIFMRLYSADEMIMISLDDAES